MGPASCDDALAFIISSLKSNPNCFGKQYCDFDVFKAMEAFCRGEFAATQDQTIQRTFYDATWQLCRMGVLRPGGMPYHGVMTGTPMINEYCLTDAGREWLKSAPDSYFPTDAGRYAQTLAPYQAKLGAGFMQRAHEAAKSYEAGTHLACCAMCGAAAESALLAVAISKTGDERAVLRKYAARDGRREVVRLIFAAQTGALRSQFEAAFNILSYWRDDAAHGKATTISELEAYEALGRLLRLSSFVCDNWAALTS